MHINARKVINPDRSLRGTSGLPQGLNRSRGRPSISFSPVRRLTERTGKLNYAKKGIILVADPITIVQGG